MIRIAKSEARKRFAEVLTRSRAGERVKVTHYGKTIAVIVPSEDLDRLVECEKRTLAREGRQTLRPATTRRSVAARKAGDGPRPTRKPDVDPRRR